MSVMDILEMYQRMKPLIIRDIANGTSNKVTITGGGGGVSDHGLLSGLSDDDHTQYHTNARGDARYYLSSAIDSWRTTHLADTDAHHAMQHGIVDAAQHTVTASQYDLIGATATNTLGVLTPASDASAGNTVLITDGSGNITINDLAVVDVNATGDITSSATTGRLYLESTAPQQWAFQASGLFMYVEPQTTNSSFKIRNVANSDIFSVNTATGLVDMSAAATVGTSLAVNTDTLYVSDTYDQVWINSGTPDGSAAMRIEGANADDVTMYIKQATSQTADMWRLVDSSGSTIVRADESGNLESGNYVPLVTGWHLSPTGTSQLVDVEILGSLHATVFSADEIHSVDGELLITAGGTGKLYEAVTLTDVAIDDVGKPSTTLKVKDPSVGPYPDFVVGDVLHVKGIAGLPTTTPPDAPVFDFWSLSAEIPSGSGMRTVDCWFTVTAAARGGDDHYSYTCTVEKAQSCTLNVDVAIVSYGKYVSASEAPGYIQLSARGSQSADSLTPVINMVSLTSAEPWDGTNLATHVRIGKLDQLFDGSVTWGFQAGADLSDDAQPKITASNRGLDLYKASLQLNDGSNTTGKIWDNGSLKFGTAISSVAGDGEISSSSGNGLQFDSATGDFAIGHYDTTDGDAEYMFWDQSEGTLTISGAITIPADNLAAKWESLDGTPAQLSSLLGDPGDSGLYLTSAYLGFYDQADGWTVYFTNAGYISAGEGDVQISNTGIDITAWDGDPFNAIQKNSLSWDDNSMSLYGEKDDSDQRVLKIVSETPNGSGDPGAHIEILTFGSTYDAQITMTSGSAASDGVIELDAEYIKLVSVPTSDPGIPGAVWRSGTDLKIST